MKTLLLLGLASIGLLCHSGCSTTKYRSVTREPGGIVTERELTATSVLVQRDLGKVVLGADSLAGAKSDQTALVTAVVTAAIGAAK